MVQVKKKPRAKNLPKSTVSIPSLKFEKRSQCHTQPLSLVPLLHLLTIGFEKDSKGKTAGFHFDAPEFYAGRVNPGAAKGPWTP